ncbi:hypothetical protein HK102_003335 [Quaeritorhiza haematococci]|nr:hypothetical protein HK102_003335 [Quaeritorhiza haematococci]
MASLTATASLDWNPDVFLGLHDLITNAFSESAPSLLSRINALLVRYRPYFANLLAEPPRNQNSRSQLDKGQVTVHGSTRQANEEFVRETRILSDLLDMPEDRAATLLQHAIYQQGRFDKDVRETAVFLYHAERGYMLACLKLMLSGALDQKVPESCRRLFQHHIDEISKSAGAGVSFPRKVLDTVTNLKQVLGSLKEDGGEGSTGLNASQQPGSLVGGNTLSLGRTTAPSGAASSVSVSQLKSQGVEDSLVNIRIEKLSEERIELANILILLAFGSHLSTDDVLYLLQTLQGAERSDPVSLYLLCALLAALTMATEAASSNATPGAESLVQNRNAVNSVNQILRQSSWKTTEIRAVILLQWSICLRQSIRTSPTLEQELRLGPDLIDRMVEAAIMSNVFQYILTDVLAFRGSKIDDMPIVLEERAPSSRNGAVDMAAGLRSSQIQQQQQQQQQQQPKPLTREDFDPEFQRYMSYLVEELLSGFIRTMGRVVKSMKNKDEDIDVVGSRSGMPTRTAFGTYQAVGATGPVGSTVPPQRNFESLLNVIALLYQDRPDTGLRYWTDIELFKFLKWATDVRTPRLQRAYFNMLGSLATGYKSSQRAYDFLNAGPHQVSQPHHARVSWSSLFRSLNLNAASLSQSPDLEISPEEVKMLRCFLRLLRKVVEYSATARTTLYENQHFRAVHTLFNLLVCRIPIDLKAALFDAIAAFCIPVGGVGSEIAQNVWIMLEQAQVLGTMPRNAAQQQGMMPGLQQQQQQQGGISGMAGAGSGGAGGIISREGIVFDLEETESMSQSYPETLAFLGLLNTLISVPASTQMSGVLNSLGAGYRVPGIRPYLNFVVDYVFLKIHIREFADPEERWRMTEACLKFFDKCLRNYDVGSILMGVSGDLNGSGGVVDTSAAGLNMGGMMLATPPQQQQQLLQQQQTAYDILAATLHPGFELLCRILAGSRLTEKVFSILNSGDESTGSSAGVEAVNADAFSTPFFGRSVLYALRIVYRVLAQQRQFLEVFVPAVVDATNSGLGLGGSFDNNSNNQALGAAAGLGMGASASAAATAAVAASGVDLPPSMTGLDQLLAFHKEIVIQIALYVNCVVNEEICLLSVKILTLLSQSPVFLASDVGSVAGGAGAGAGFGFGGGSSGVKLNRLVSLLHSSDESQKIVYGFVQRLELDEPEPVATMGGDSSAADLAFSAGAGGAVGVGGGWVDGSAMDQSNAMAAGAAHNNLSDVELLEKPGLVNSVRLAILDMLLLNLPGGGLAGTAGQQQRPPTISHFLLGYDVTKPLNRTEIPDPNTPHARTSCLHVILDLLRDGTVDSRGSSAVAGGVIGTDGGAVDVGTLEIGGVGSNAGGSGVGQAALEPLFLRHPALSERCYQLIYRLCSDRHTSSPTMRYLRTREDFFSRQLRAMPVDQVSWDEDDALDDAMMDDLVQQNGQMQQRQRRPLSYRKFAGRFAELHQRGWLMKTVALELHMTALGGQRSHTQRLLDLLYLDPQPEQLDTEEDAFLQEGSARGDMFGDDSMVIGGGADGRKEARQFEQPLTKMLEILNSLNFNDIYPDRGFGLGSGDLRSSATSQLSPLMRFTDYIDFTSYVRHDERGCEVYDIRTLHSLMLSRLKLLEKQGAISTIQQRSAAREELKSVLYALLNENGRRELVHAQLHCIQAWNQILRITLAECFELLPADLREEKLFELLANVLPKMNADNASLIVVEEVSAAVLSLIARLRQDRAYQTVLQAPSTMNTDVAAFMNLRLPWDSLQQVVLKGILDGVLKPGATTLMRGNYYASFLYYLQYTSPDDYERDRNRWLAYEGVSSSEATGMDTLGLGLALDPMAAAAGGSDLPAPSALSNLGAYRANLLAGNLATVNEYGDRLLDALCKDASNGSDVWKTVAFSALAGLYELSLLQPNISGGAGTGGVLMGKTPATSAATNRVLAFVVKRNYLDHFVSVLKREDEALQGVLRSEPGEYFDERTRKQNDAKRD